MCFLTAPLRNQIGLSLLSSLLDWPAQERRAAARLPGFFAPLEAGGSVQYICLAVSWELFGIFFFKNIYIYISIYIYLCMDLTGIYGN